MVGLGTQNTPEDGVEFIEDGGDYSFPMYWEDGFRSWEAFGVTGQPAAVLMLPDGRITDPAFGKVDLDTFLDLIDNPPPADG